MRKVLVTGGRGLVGSAIEAEIKIGSEFDLRRPEAAHAAIATHNPTHIIHCAARVGDGGANGG